jgi:hypothetical protein
MRKQSKRTIGNLFLGMICFSSVFQDAPGSALSSFSPEVDFSGSIVIFLEGKYGRGVNLGGNVGMTFMPVLLMARGR